MSRREELDPATLDAAGRGVFDDIARPRDGVVGGPFEVWMALPGVAAAANDLGNALRLHGTLDRHLFELVTLVCARHWGSEYPWRVHESAARRFGASDASIEALATDSVVAAGDPDEELVVRAARELLDGGDLADATYDELETRFGRATVVELVTVVGFYSTASIVARVFRAPTGAE